MRIRVPLAGLTLAWRFRGLDSLADYIGSHPWLDKPAIEIVRVGDTAAAAAVLAAIEEECVLTSRHVDAVRSHVIEPSLAVQRGPVVALMAALDLHNEMSPLEAANAVGREAAVVPRIFLFPPLPAARPQLRSELEQFADMVSKLESLARFTVLCLDTPAAPLGGRCHDLVDGLIPAPTDLLSATEHGAWKVYLHHRIAWETGGRLSDAARLAEEFKADGLAVGDDDLTETRLLKAATKRFVLLDGAIRNTIETGVSKAVNREEVAGSFPRELFWSPTETAGLLPRPWVARALLAASPAHPRAELLRNCLVCVPLGHALLAACAVFETQLRGRIRLPEIPTPSDPCMKSWSTFTAGGSLERALFPSTGPAVPTSPWEFASFGECLANEVVRDRSSSWRHDMRILRNHLAHGHHVGWAAVKKLKSLAERVAVG